MADLTDAEMIQAAPWYRKPLCWLGLCETFHSASDDTGCWGECSICGKRAGFVSRDQLRRFADADAEAARTTPEPTHDS